MARRRYRCPAKLNLRLDVGPPGPDGLHPVVTVLAALDLGDELEVEARPGPLALEVEGAEGGPPPDLGPPGENLVLRAPISGQVAAVNMTTGQSLLRMDIHRHTATIITD